jgi:hypothetical protein
MSSRRQVQDKGLPLIVLELPKQPRSPIKPKPLKSGRINLFAIEAGYYHNGATYRSSRDFPSLFGPGRGYNDISWI